MNYDLIPDRLKSNPTWVNWHYFTKKNGESTKVPIDSRTGRFASVSDIDSLRPYNIAVQRASTDPRVSGIGYVFTDSDPFTGIDFDHCRNPQTGEITPEILAIIQSLDSYTEVSISGTGIHIIIRAELSGSGCRKKGIEIYDRSRYFIITGNHIPGTPTIINERQNELNALHQTLFRPTPTTSSQAHPEYCGNLADDTLINRILMSRQGEKFDRLFSGDWSKYPSQSESDLALCGILAFWTKDRIQIDRIFRSSALYREKWNESRNRKGMTYGEMTITKALGNAR
ncbi:MAG: hypothetical protein H8D34_34245 [Chloroflexi bacterium]|nr:hypothetical protein [Chloroflexota bacterium]